jgi:hypothetical protein
MQTASYTYSQETAAGGKPALRDGWTQWIGPRPTTGTDDRGQGAGPGLQAPFTGQAAGSMHRAPAKWHNLFIQQDFLLRFEFRLE